jgi:hypothetical protein
MIRQLQDVSVYDESDIPFIVNSCQPGYKVDGTQTGGALNVVLLTSFFGGTAAVAGTAVDGAGAAI